MKHTSVKLDTPSEFIQLTPVNPLISKCQIKVCYVGDEPNRNRSVITKEVAKQIANTIPGTPIVGYYNEDNEDFEEHNRTIDIKNKQIVIKDATRPYGFVDLNAPCWFQKFLDDDQTEHEYLMTEGWLWTGQYPEAQRILEHGNNQSMELDKKLINAWWTKDNNGKPMFFIINEAVMSKLCILGTENEPCFEGANITSVQFSLTKDFNDQLQKMKDELTELLNNEKGGAQVFTTYAVTVGDALWTALYAHIQDKYQDTYSIDGIFVEDEHIFAVLKDNTAENKYVRLNFSFSESDGFSAEENVNEVEYTPAEEPQFSLSDIETYIAEYKKKEDEKEEGPEDGEKDKKDKSEENDSDESTEDKKDSEEDDDDEKKKKKTSYSLDEIVEYQELSTKFSELEAKYNALAEEKTQLESELQPLREFKLAADRKAKEDMINSFYMLDDEAKKDVRENIDKYSLDDIEAKLSILCVRNKVSFNLEDDNNPKGPITYNLGMTDFDESNPAWVKAVLDTAKTLN